ncbi:MAG: hypothetical protein DMF86_16540 [Acidobacteria bacterium]|nr:MAG: hypothetical protein DMF86_16540 [Acidobacteriota bacterium]
MSADGSSWTQVGGQLTLAINATAYFGLAVTSHDPTQRNTSTFDNVSIGPVTGGQIPSPWVQTDVGATGVAGSATYASGTGTFTVKGAGADVWGTQDGFHFVYQPLNGDGTIVARVTHVDPTSSYAKAAIMIRETLHDNSAHVILDLKPDNGNEFMRRPTTGAATEWLANGAQAAPAWLKLTRSGSTFTGYTSADGQSWTQVGQTTVTMSTNAYVGILVCAISTTQLNTSTFDNVTVTPAGPGNIVIYASDIGASSHPGWNVTSDPTSPNQIKLVTPDNGWASTDVPLASPTTYIDATFNANAGTSYRLWLRLQATPATPTAKYNDSVWVQFSDALSGGSSIYPLNSTSGLNVNLATDAGATSLDRWGWANTAYWLPSQTTAFTFATSGTHTIRIQIREDGVQLDQIVLSPVQYYNNAPGGPTNDSTIVQK